ncbi:hypothetical protein GFV14_00357 [Candidatus Hartigia pinicola]|nr:hypothetical protein GFV14_00357 [Candidatus Hartigia pinicola]
MSQVDLTLIVLLFFCGLGLISHNIEVTLAMFCLLLMRITPLNSFFYWVEKYSLPIGVIILIVGTMSPIAHSKISAQDIFNSCLNWKSILAILIGILVSWLGSRGVFLMRNQPSMVSGLLVGTIIGVILFRGVPVGPLIASGILSLLLGKS